jgi:hypothetical protein
MGSSTPAGLQPMAGAMCRAIVSSIAALYSTPSWLGTVRRMVSEAADRAVEPADLILPRVAPEQPAVEVGGDRHDAAADGHARLALVPGARPGVPEKGDLLRLELVERHLRVLQEEGGAHQVHALLGRPERTLARARAPPDAIRQPGRLGLDGEHRVAGPAAGVRADDACTGDRRPEQRRLLTHLLAVEGVAERLGAVPRRLGRAAADAELEPATGEKVGRAGVLGHVERVLVPHVDDAGSDLDPACPHADRGEQREGRSELAGEVVDAHERPVDAELLRGNRELDGLVERVGPRVREPSARMPRAEREEPDPLWVLHTHPNVIDRSIIPGGDGGACRDLADRAGAGRAPGHAGARVHGRDHAGGRGRGRGRACARAHARGRARDGERRDGDAAWRRQPPAPGPP